MPFLFFLPLCNHGRSKLSAENTNGIIPPSARSHLPLQGRQIGFILLGSLAKGDSPQCGKMSRSDKGDGRQLGAVTK